MDKYPQAPREPKRGETLQLTPSQEGGERKGESERWREEEEEEEKNPNPKQMASIGARNTESHRKSAALLSLIHIFQSLRGAGTVN